MAAEIVRVPDLAALHESAADAFVSAAVDAVRERGIFRVALAGGSTPEGMYTLLAHDSSRRSEVPWPHVHFFWGDERHVPPDHSDSNFRMAWQAMLAHLPIEPGQIWRIKGEYEDASKAANEYEHDLRRAFDIGEGRWPEFDLILLGMGADGHTASLFPGTAALQEQRRLALANRVQKLDTDRITLTAPVLNNAVSVLFLVHGADKAEALKDVLEGAYQPDRRPAQLVRPSRGRLRWIVDQSAARLLSPVSVVDAQATGR